MVMVQVVDVPVHAPDQPLKVEPVFGVAVKVMFVLELNDAEQVEPQSMPEGDEVIVPLPIPDL